MEFQLTNPLPPKPYKPESEQIEMFRDFEGKDTKSPAFLELVNQSAEEVIGNSMEDVFGPVIYKYTRAQAIEDGALVDLSQITVCKEHYKYPIAVTSEVWGIIDRAVRNKKHCNDYNGVLHDVLFMSRTYNKKIDESTRLFKVKITGAGRQSVFEFKMVCGPNDDMTPCMTIMMPYED
jgi:hypothetical protein